MQHRHCTDSQVLARSLIRSLIILILITNMAVVISPSRMGLRGPPGKVQLFWIFYDYVEEFLVRLERW